MNSITKAMNSTTKTCIWIVLSIRVIELGFVYKWMGFDCPKFQLFEHTKGPMSSDNWGTTVKHNRIKHLYNKADLI